MTKWMHKFVWMGALGLLACGGGIGQGCNSEVLPTGFPIEQTVANAAHLRISRAGLSFLEQTAPRILSKQLLPTGGGSLDFPIQTSTSAPFSLVGIDFTPTICPDGPTTDKCTAQLDLAKATTELDAQTPHTLSFRPTVPLLLKDTPVRLDYRALGSDRKIILHIAYGDNTSCDREIPSATPHALPIRVRVPFVEGTTAPRTGYTYADVDNATIDTSGISSDNVKICADCGSLGSWACNGILNSGLIKGNIVDTLKSQIDGMAKNAMRNALCTAPRVTATGTPSCPTGSKSNADKTQCVYDNAPEKCVPSQLGLDGRADLSSMLSDLSPGTQGKLDYLFAAGGTMDPWPMAATPTDNERTSNGMTFHLMGGAIESETSRCVNPIALVRPTGIPVPDELKANSLPDWPLANGPHAGFALSERFLNYALGSAYNSGLLCLKITSDRVPQITTGALSLLAGSLKTLPTQGKTGAVALVTHPSSPPSMRIGTGSDVNSDPLLRLDLNKFGIDIMVWSHDRYLRAFTYTADISIPINLDVDDSNPGEAVLKPNIGKITLNNPLVTNSELLAENPTNIATGLTGIVESLVGGVAANAAQALPLNGILSAYGIGIATPKGAVRRVVKDNDNFLGVFVNFTDTGAVVTPAAVRGNLRSLSLPSMGCQASPMSSGSVATVAALAALGVLVARRRRSAKWAVLCVVAGLPACDCNDDQAAKPKCGDDCKQTCEAAVDRGLVGAYGSAVQGADGKVYVAGYADALFPSSGIGVQPYGDLAVGTIDVTSGATTWEVIDGIPARQAGTCPTYDPTGWRKGETDPGDNVGLWTSSAIAPNGTRHVAYYDATHGALKYAVREPGNKASWKTHVISQKDGVDAGRYVSLSLRGARPVLAFHRLSTGASGSSTAAVVMAEANVDVPSKAEDWKLSNVASVDSSSCSALRPGDGSSTCGPRKCVTGTGLCADLMTGCSGCGATEACVAGTDGKPACATAVMIDEPATTPKRFGIHTKLFVSGTSMAVAAYDALSGQLHVYRPNGSAWDDTVVDGAAVTGGAANAGAGVSGAFDAAGALHLAYTDPAHGTLRYAKLGSAPEQVDDGTSTTATPFADRVHLISPDTALRIDAEGNVQIAYKDGTAGTLRFAVKKGGSWTRKVGSEPGQVAGSFPSFLPDGRVVHFSRMLDKSVAEATGDLRVSSEP